MRLIEREKSDTIRVHLLMSVSEEFMLTSAEKAMKSAEEGLKLAQKIKWTRGVAMAYSGIGNAYDLQGNFSKALEYRLKELEKWKETGNRRTICVVMGNIGVSYSDQGNNLKAMEYYISSLELAEKINNKEMMASNLSNIGSIHHAQKENEDALEYYFRALRLAEKEGIKKFISNNSGNIGNVYADQLNFNKALEFYLKALKIEEESGNERTISIWLANIGSVYQQQSDSARNAGNTTLAKEKSANALEYFFKALKYTKNIGSEYLEAYARGNIGSIYVAEKNYKAAEIYMQQSFDLGVKINSVELITDGHQRFFELYKKMNLPTKALEH
ncbi:MAG: tetratricopeptide repeat protein, partial [Bacteroidia bacterium]|nr:tetratricopeptide repeat protein [Bacteroidia bacterium]